MRNNKALVMLGLAVVLGLAAVGIATRWISEQAGSSDKIAVALVDVSLGTRLLPEMIRMVDWPANAKPPGSFTDVKLLEARVVRTSLQRGEPIMEAKLAPPGTKGGLSAVVAEGKRAITVRVNDVVGVAGFALPGNFIDILLSTQEDGLKTNNRDQTISKIVLEHILVLAVAQELGRDETKPKVVNAVTLEVTPEQAEKLDLARSVGTLSLVLRNQIDPRFARTEGATKASLFNVRPPAGLPPEARSSVVSHKRSAKAANPPEEVQVFKGMAETIQQF